MTPSKILERKRIKRSHIAGENGITPHRRTTASPPSEEGGGPRERWRERIQNETTLILFMSSRAAQQSAVERISTEASSRGRGVNMQNSQTQSNFTHKEFGAIIAPKTLLAFLEIHSTRLYWLGRDDGTGWTGNKNAAVMPVKWHSRLRNMLLQIPLIKIFEGS